MSTRLLRPVRAAARAGFTLIELIAVMAIIMILVVALLPNINNAFERAQVTACTKNLQSIGEGLLSYHTQYDRWPRGSGVKFFGSLVADEAWEGSVSTTKKLTCPAVEMNFLTPGQEGIPLEEWYTDKARLDGGWSAYAGRDQREHPLKRFPASAKEALVADDNDGGGNHKTATVVLWGDWSARALEIVDEREAGTADIEDAWVIVGPDAQNERLQTLSIHD
jgi:prepilin-type N-terminal cleavage/methylation domain-containing protein